MAQSIVFARSFRLYSQSSYFQAVLQAAGCPPRQTYEFYQEELRSDPYLRREYLAAIEQKKIPQKHKKYEARFNNAANVVPYYAYVREAKPDIIVETGTATGSMTSWLLAALTRNGSGKLISVDIPPKAGHLSMNLTVDRAEIGYLIPQEYRSAWHYIEGDARHCLPNVLAEHPTSMFVHDSLHTRTHMLFEYSVARSLLPEGAVIVSDDIMWNNSFFKFVETHHLQGYGCISNPNVGFCVNRFDAFETEIDAGR